MFAFTRFTLARQFMLLSLLILLSGMLIIGVWVGRQIEIGVVNRTGAVTALYVDSFISPYLQNFKYTNDLLPEQMVELRRLLEKTSLGREIVAFKIWSMDGHVLFSPNPDLIGRQFPLHDDLNAAWQGHVNSGISDLSAPENEYENQLWDQLIETYLPIRAEGSGGVIAVAEFYQTLDALEREVRAAQLRSWLVVGTATAVMYLLLAGLVGRASNMILAQQEELRDKVAQLSTLLEQNQELHGRVRRAAARTTALNERFLRRISADLHDGPGQDLSLALLRIEALAEACEQCPALAATGRVVADDFRTVQTALNSALSELRAISAGLRLPELQSLTPAETAARAVKDFERKTRVSVSLSTDQVPAAGTTPAKITLYRVIQEALANGLRHGGGVAQRVEVCGESGHLNVSVSDAGPGFDPMETAPDGHLGLAGMRERVQALGGTFALQAELGQGVRLQASIPLDDDPSA